MEQAENPSPSRGYYCHNCNNTISIPVTNFLCPDCHLGFIEKLPEGPSPASFTERTTENRDDTDEADPLVVLHRVFNDISSNLEVIIGAGESNAGTSDRPSSSNRRDASSNASRIERRQGRNQFHGTFEHMLSDLLNNMSRTAAQNLDSNGSVVVVGNPGDYAWGREGLDTIVTQLLNQMDSSGPPPLARDKINELPFISITQQQVSENIQCSVCWDSFKMTERVRQLPCDHIYHDLCIVPWLELHGTCPICRKLLSEDNEARITFPHTGGLEALLSDAHRLTILQRTFTPGSRRETRRQRIQCYQCQNYGHIARECPQGNRRRTQRTGQDHNQGRQNPSQAVPLHEFLEEFDYGDSFTDSDSCTFSECDYVFDLLTCEICGCPLSSHSGSPCMGDFDGWERNTVSVSGGSSTSANFGSNSRHSEVARNQERKRRNLTCFKCNKVGHLARECWTNFPRCRVCGKHHEATNCKWSSTDRYGASQSGWNRQSNATNNGWIDTEEMRWNRHSTQNNGWSDVDYGPSTSRYQSFEHENYRCFQCNEVGHIARNCPTRNSHIRRRKCRKCGREGHITRHCLFN